MSEDSLFWESEAMKWKIETEELRTQLDAYKAALEKIAKRKSGEYIIDAYYEIRKIAEEVLQTKGVE